MQGWIVCLPHGLLPVYICRVLESLFQNCIPEIATFQLCTYILCFLAICVTLKLHCAFFKLTLFQLMEENLISETESLMYALYSTYAIVQKWQGRIPVSKLVPQRDCSLCRGSKTASQCQLAMQLSFFSSLLNPISKSVDKNVCFESPRTVCRF